MSLRRHQLQHNYLGYARLLSIPSRPHTTGPRTSRVWLAQCGDSAPTKFSANFSSAEIEWPGSFGERTGHGSMVVTQSRCCHGAGLGSAVGYSKGTSPGAACSAWSCCRNLTWDTRSSTGFKMLEAHYHYTGTSCSAFPPRVRPSLPCATGSLRSSIPALHWAGKNATRNRRLLCRRLSGRSRGLPPLTPRPDSALKTPRAEPHPRFGAIP